jgi:hypothetical protein
MRAEMAAARLRIVANNHGQAEWPTFMHNTCLQYGKLSFQTKASSSANESKHQKYSTKRRNRRTASLQTCL